MFKKNDLEKIAKEIVLRKFRWKNKTSFFVGND